MSTLSKNVDLKCSETLSESPPPPPSSSSSSISQLLPSSSSTTSVFASTVVAIPPPPPSSNPPTHHHHHQVQSTTTTIETKYDRGGGGGAYNNIPASFLQFMDGGRKKMESRISPIEQNKSSADSSSISTTMSGKMGSNSSTAAAKSLSFGIANVVSTAKPSLSSHYTTQSQQQSAAASYQPSPHVFPGLQMPNSAASVWPFVQQHAVLPSQLAISPSKQAIFSSSATSIQASPNKMQTTATSATLPLTLSPSKGSAGGHGRPVTLHVSTSRGPAVLQLQQTTATPNSSTTASGKQSVKLLSAPIGMANPTHAQSLANSVVRPIAGNLPTTAGAVPPVIPTRVPVLRPSPVHPMGMAAATAALLSQLTPTAPGFGLDHLQQQHLAATLLRSSPLAGIGGSIVAGTAPGAAVIPQAISINQQLSAQANRSVIVSGSHQSTSAGSYAALAPAGSTSASPTKSSVASTASNSTAPPIAPSPTRPSILRKRMMDVSNGSSSPAKRIAYEPIPLAKRANEKDVTPDPEIRSGLVMVSSSSNIENPEAGNSNQSSSASTISAGSTLDNGNGNGHHLNLPGSPSPRKRPRKQQLSEFTSGRCGGGYGSDDDTSTPVMGYQCEAIEEETVAGPTGIGGSDGRYVSSSASTSSPHRSQRSLFAAAGEFYDPYHTPSKRMKMERSGSPSLSLSGSHRLSQFERPSTSFDQLQQQIEQQRKHVPEYRPRPSLLAQFELPYDSKRFHFAVQEDVKPKEEKRPSMVDMSNQKQIWHRISGWKAHLMCVQFENVDQDERTNFDDLNGMYQFLQSWSSVEATDRVGRVDYPDAEERAEIESLQEMALTNMQRVRVIREQMDESKKQLLSLLKHKANVEKLIHRYTTKRPIRKKDRARNGTMLD